jgi:hypothetical protein
MPTASETPNQAARTIGTHDHAFMPAFSSVGGPSNIARLPSAHGSFTRRLRRPATAAAPRPWAHSPARAATSTTPAGSQATRHKYTARRPAARLSCRWAAAHRGAALGAWRVSPGAARAPSQAPARPPPQGRARRPSRSAPTTTRSSRTPSGTSRALAVPSIHHTTSRADPLRPNAATGARYVHTWRAGRDVRPG